MWLQHEYGLRPGCCNTECRGGVFGCRSGPVLRTVVVSVRCVSPLCDPVDRVGLWFASYLLVGKNERHSKCYLPPDKPAVGSRHTPGGPAMQTPQGVTPSMVAVGNSDVPGTVQSNANTQHAIPMTFGWHVRRGRNDEFILWEDALNDALARIRLTRAVANEEPPEHPGESASAKRKELWALAVLQYQREGTVLFDAIRQSILLEGAYANRDVRLIGGWKKEGVKDGTGRCFGGRCLGWIALPSAIRCRCSLS